MQVVCHITYIVSRGDFTFSYGDDRTDSAEDCSELGLTQGEGATALEALEAALSALDASVEALEAELDPADLNFIVEAAQDFYTETGWEVGSLGFERIIRPFDQGHTRWSVWFIEVEGSPEYDFLDDIENHAAISKRLATAEGK